MWCGHQLDKRECPHVFTIYNRDSPQLLFHVQTCMDINCLCSDAVNKGLYNCFECGLSLQPDASLMSSAQSSLTRTYPSLLPHALAPPPHCLSPLIRTPAHRVREHLQPGWRARCAAHVPHPHPAQRPAADERRLVWQPQHCGRRKQPHWDCDRPRWHSDHHPASSDQLCAGCDEWLFLRLEPPRPQRCPHGWRVCGFRRRRCWCRDGCPPLELRLLFVFFPSLFLPLASWWVIDVAGGFIINYLG